MKSDWLGLRPNYGSFIVDKSGVSRRGEEPGSFNPIFNACYLETRLFKYLTLVIYFLIEG